MQDEYQVKPYTIDTYMHRLHDPHTGSSQLFNDAHFFQDWEDRDSNPQPYACHARTLPAARAVMIATCSTP